MRHFARIIRVGIFPRHDLQRMADHQKLDKAEIYGEKVGRDDQPSHDLRKCSVGNRGKDEIDKPAGGVGEDLVILLVDGLGFYAAGSKQGSQRSCQTCFGENSILSFSAYGTMLQGTGDTWASVPATDPNTRLITPELPVLPETISVAAAFSATYISISKTCPYFSAVVISTPHPAYCARIAACGRPSSSLRRL